MRRFLLSCRPLRLMYDHRRLVISVRGSGLLPTTALSEPLGCIGFMNAAFARPPPLRFAGFALARDFVAFFLAVPRFAVFFEDDFFLAELFFFVAIASPEWD